MGKRARDEVHRVYGSGKGLRSDSGEHDRKLKRANQAAAVAQRAAKRGKSLLPLEIPRELLGGGVEKDETEGS